MPRSVRLLYSLLSDHATQSVHRLVYPNQDKPGFGCTRFNLHLRTHTKKCTLTCTHGFCSTFIKLSSTFKKIDKHSIIRVNRSNEFAIFRHFTSKYSGSAMILSTDPCIPLNVPARTFTLTPFSRLTTGVFAAGISWYLGAISLLAAGRLTHN